MTVAIGLVLGGTAFALTPQGRGTGRVSDFIPDGVLLVVGTILLGIGLGQLGNERLMTPRWNWVSFIGLTVSGMLVLVVLRGALKAALGRDRPSRGTPRFLGVLGTELLLVGGLGLMMYGALNNLVLGANGFRTGFKGNSEGVVVWIAAALFLIEESRAFLPLNRTALSSPHEARCGPESTEPTPRTGKGRRSGPVAARAGRAARGARPGIRDDPRGRGGKGGTAGTRRTARRRASTRGWPRNSATRRTCSSTSGTARCGSRCSDAEA